MSQAAFCARVIEVIKASRPRYFATDHKVNCDFLAGIQSREVQQKRETALDASGLKLESVLPGRK